MSYLPKTKAVSVPVQGFEGLPRLFKNRNKFLKTYSLPAPPEPTETG
jgi:hypothetical protein